MFLFSYFNNNVECVEETSTPLDLPHQYLYGWVIGRGEVYYKDSNPYISIDLYDEEEAEIFTNLSKMFDDFEVERVSYSMFDPFRLLNIFLNRNVVYATVKITNQQVINLLGNHSKYSNAFQNTMLCTRGYFEAIDGGINVTDDGLEVLVDDDDEYFFDDILYTNTVAFNLIVDLYTGHDEYGKQSNFASVDRVIEMYAGLPRFECLKQSCDAIEPFKNKPSDVSYNVTVVEKIKEVNGIYYYGTGLKLCIDYGYYIELHDNNLYEHGYALASGTIILESDCDEEVVIPLVKLYPGATELKLPTIVAKLVCRKVCV